MRPKQILRASRLAKLGAGALMLGIPASAVALTANQADAQSATQLPNQAAALSAAHITVNRHHVTAGRSVTVKGTTSPRAAGQWVALQFAVPHGPWRQLGRARVGRTGHFRFVTKMARTGFLRVTAATSGTVPRSGGSVQNLTGGAAVTPSRMQRVAVAARFNLRSRQYAVLGGQSVDVHGRLLPGVGGRRVRLLGRSGGSWHAVASTRTGRYGGFDLRYTPSGAQSLRVRFAGDGRNTPASGYAGGVTTFRPSLASWFTDAGATACGFHAYYGVANKTLPCGTKVTFRYGGRSVTATVEDRGPYVGGREWDLNQNTAAALGFGGVGTVWSSI